MAFHLTPADDDGASDALAPLRAAWERLQKGVFDHQPLASREAILDFVSTACFTMRGRLALGERSDHQVASAAYLRIDELQRACCALAEGEGGQVHVERTEDLVSATVLFEKTAPSAEFAVHVELHDGSRHEALQFASRVLGAWTSYFAA